MSRPWLWLLLGLMGCMTEQRFRDDADAATCAWQEDCFDADPQTCMQEAEAAWSGIDGDCDFHRSKARRCVRQLERLACPSEQGGGAMPAACDAVWDCP